MGPWNTPGSTGKGVEPHEVLESRQHSQQPGCNQGLRHAWSRVRSYQNASTEAASKGHASSTGSGCRADSSHQSRHGFLQASAFESCSLDKGVNTRTSVPNCTGQTGEWFGLQNATDRTLMLSAEPESDPVPQQTPTGTMLSGIAGFRSCGHPITPGNCWMEESYRQSVSKTMLAWPPMAVFSPAQRCSVLGHK